MTPHLHQVNDARNLLAIVREHGSALDASDTGTGKSITALLVAAALKFPVQVVCPLSVGPAWEQKFAMTGVTGTWINYDRARVRTWRPSQPNALVIFDEVHRCKSPTSLQAQLLLRVASAGHRTLLLSATPFASPLETRAVLHALKLCPWSKWYGMLPRYGVFKNRHLHNALMWNKSPDTIAALRELVAPRMVKTRWQEIGRAHV